MVAWYSASDFVAESIAVCRSACRFARFGFDFGLNGCDSRFQFLMLRRQLAQHILYGYEFALRRRTIQNPQENFIHQLCVVGL